MRRLLGFLTAGIFILSLHVLPGCGSPDPAPVNLGPGDHRTEAQKADETEQLDQMQKARAKAAGRK